MRGYWAAEGKGKLCRKKEELVATLGWKRRLFLHIGSIKEENGHKRKLNETSVVSLRIGSAALRKVTVLVCFSHAVIKHSAKPTQREKD